MALYVVSSGVLSLSFIFHHSPFFYPPLQIFFISKIAIWPNPSQEKKRILKIYATIKLLLYNHHLCIFLSFLLGDNFQSQILKRGMRKNMSAWGDLKSSWNRYLPRGLTMFLAKVDLAKWNLALRVQFQMLIFPCVREATN